MSQQTYAAAGPGGGLRIPGVHVWRLRRSDSGLRRRVRKAVSVADGPDAGDGATADASAGVRRPDLVLIDDVDVGFGQPPGRRHRRLEANPPNNLLDIGIDALMRGEEGRHLDANATVDVLAVEATEGQAAPRKILQQQGANMRFVWTAAGHRHDVADLEFGQAERLPVDELHDRSQKRVDKHHEPGRDRGMRRISAASEKTDGGRTPQRGGGIESAHGQSLAEDQSASSH